MGCRQWAERLLEGGGSEQWGDKWEERFKDGAGSKQVHPSPCPFIGPLPSSVLSFGERQKQRACTAGMPGVATHEAGSLWLPDDEEGLNEVTGSSVHIVLPLMDILCPAGRDLDAGCRGRALPTLVGRGPLWQWLGAQARQLHHRCGIFLLFSRFSQCMQPA